MMRPVPFADFARPTRRVFPSRSTRPQKSDRASPDRVPVKSSKGISVPMWGVRRFGSPSNSALCSAVDNARPTTFRSSSLRTLGQSKDHGWPIRLSGLAEFLALLALALFGNKETALLDHLQDEIY